MKLNKDTKKQNNYDNYQFKCPKCGGTEYTPVRKKLSPLTGFAISKVDLICKNCGKIKK